MRLDVIRFLLSTLTLLTLASAPTTAQTPSATVRGLVEDQTGGRLPDARVRMIRDETGETRETISDAEGLFAFAELPTGRYMLQAERPGFSVFRQVAQVAVGRYLWIEAKLVVATSAVVTSAAEARVPVIERHSPAHATLIDQDHVLNLPLDGRNFLELALLAPGTVPAPQGSAS